MQRCEGSPRRASASDAIKEPTVSPIMLCHDCRRADPKSGPAHIRTPVTAAKNGRSAFSASANPGCHNATYACQVYV
eukprot:4241877-Pyramimonas_sp.AAC.1